MKHQPTVAQGIRGCSFLQIAVKSIFQLDMIMGVGCIVIKMTILFIEVAITIIIDLDDLVFYSKSMGKVFTDLMMMDFDCPVVQIFAIK
ncbi:hypothetical protein D3C85_1432190 [compost metagenome]